MAERLEQTDPPETETSKAKAELAVDKLPPKDPVEAKDNDELAKIAPLIDTASCPLNGPDTESHEPTVRVAAVERDPPPRRSPWTFRSSPKTLAPVADRQPDAVRPPATEQPDDPAIKP